MMLHSSSIVKSSTAPVKTGNFLWPISTWHFRELALTTAKTSLVYHLDPFFFFFFWAWAGFCWRGPAVGCGEAVDAEADWADDAEPGRGDDGSLLPPGDGLLASLWREVNRRLCQQSSTKLYGKHACVMCTLTHRITFMKTNTITWIFSSLFCYVLLEHLEIHIKGGGGIRKMKTKTKSHHNYRHKAHETCQKAI